MGTISSELLSEVFHDADVSTFRAINGKVKKEAAFQIGRFLVFLVAEKLIIRYITDEFYMQARHILDVMTFREATIEEKEYCWYLMEHSESTAFPLSQIYDYYHHKKGK